MRICLTGIPIPISVGHLTRHIVSVMLCCVVIDIDSNLLTTYGESIKYHKLQAK